MLDYFALFLLFFVGVVLFYGIIAIHDIPYELAKSRNHPHQDAIHVAGWVSLFTLHVLWPFLWIWAMLYRPDRGWGLEQTKLELDKRLSSNQTEVDQLKQQHQTLLAKVEELNQALRAVNTPRAPEPNQEVKQ